MAAINANIVVETTNLTVSPTSTSIGVTVNPINLGVYTTSPTPVGGTPGQLQYNDRNVTFGGVANTSFANGNISFTNLANLKIDGGTNAYYLQTDGTGNLTWAAGGTPTGSGVPSGANTQIQLSDGSGSFDSGPGFTFDNASNIFSTPGKAEIVGNIDSTAGVFNGDGSGLYNIQAANIPGLSVSSISNGTSNVDIATADGNIEMHVNGVLKGKFDSLGFVGDIRTGSLTLNDNYVSLGQNAGTITAPTFGVAIGSGAGEDSQGANSVAIGTKAGNTSQADNSIILNATGANLTTATTDSFIVKPIRENISASKVLYYNTTTGEITSDSPSSGSQITNGTSNVAIATLNGDAVVSIGGTTNVASFFSGGANINGDLNVVSDITSTAGIFTGDGGGLSNVTAGNITGEVPFAAVANSVAVANVVGIGNIATINLDGNVANYLDGTGSFSAPEAVVSTNNVALGLNTTAASFYGVAIAGNASANAYGVAIGSSADAGQEGIALGPNADSSGLDPRIAIGKDTLASGQESIAIGHVTKASGTTSIAIGHNANANTARSIVLNSTALALGAPAADTFNVKPVRNAGASGLPAGFFQVAYNPTTGEFVYYS